MKINLSSHSLIAYKYSDKMLMGGCCPLGVINGGGGSYKKEVNLNPGDLFYIDGLN